MADNNYRIQGITLLLEADHVLTRYLPLIPYRDSLVEALLQRGCSTRDDCLMLSDAQLSQCGLPPELTGLFRRFLRLYEYKGRGLRDIPDAQNRSAEENAALLDLMRLPGVKAIRAQLYERCGLCLRDFAHADPEALRQRIIRVIQRDHLPFSPPLPKELRTQIAVARVLTDYAP